MPLLSVIIPCYNHGAYIGETLDSVLSQDFEDFEVIVGDDASTDNSAEVIKSYGARIRPFFFKKNRGYFATIGDLFKEVKGRYVQIFSSDDLYLPGYLSASMKLMLDHGLKLTCSNIRYFGKNDRDTDLYETKEPVVFNRNEVVEVFRKSRFWVPGVSCITEVETLKKFGLPNPRLENISDWFLFNKIALAEGVGFVPQVGIAMREQEASYTANMKKDRKRRNSTYWAVLEMVDRDPTTRGRLRDSAILTVIFENLFWKLIVRPKWWGFFWYSKLSVKSRFVRSLKKRWRLVCHQSR